ncbi:hypothetical protein L596_026579 [Steinernema carpocapsae]|uniref:G-protein coupled receptors family 1 profile domain-containing protein n=1 Tax=Steinernema carpocapsae TaxID=34508 RepID=A0A4U5M1Y0_STECR|nr:hypothetical protein L596_026579 [Steinernema carpocapsae]
MADDLFSLEIYHILLLITGIPFFVISLFDSYAILFHTPSNLKLYKPYFLNLITWYQVALFCLVIFGRIDLTLDNGTLCASLYGLIEVTKSTTAAYIELFFVAQSLLNVILAVFVLFFFRYCHVCHPHSVYSTDTFWQKMVNGGITVVLANATVGIFMASILINATEPNLLFLSNVNICFKITTLVYICFSMLFSCVGGTTIMCILFTLRVLYMIEKQSIQACQRTKDLQRMLTITLLVSAAIPFVLGSIPVSLAIYVVAVQSPYTTSVFRLTVLSCVLQGLLQSIATVLLVKPYRRLLCRWIKNRSFKATTSATVFVTSNHTRIM